MRKDYHMHPKVLQDPEGAEQFIRQAIAVGLHEICITDHMPLRGNDAADRIPAGAVSRYCEAVHALAAKYSGQIRIRCGIEVDYHPAICGEIEQVLREGTFDFILGSSHLHAIPACDIFRHVSTRDDYAEAMLENTVSAAKSGYFSAIAHIDMYRWIFCNPKRFPLTEEPFSEEKHTETIDRALDAIRSAGLRLEVNTHFAANTKNTDNIYPSPYILGAALQKGLHFSFGSDAHRFDHVGILSDTLRTMPLYRDALADFEKE